MWVFYNANKRLYTLFEIQNKFSGQTPTTQSTLSTLTTTTATSIATTTTTTTSITTTTEAVELICYDLTPDQFTVAQPSYWSESDSSGSPSTHVFQHVFQIPISDTTTHWSIRVTYPHPIYNLDSWETSIPSPIPQSNTKSSQWEINGIPGWGTGTKLRTNYQAKVDFSDFSGPVSDLVFAPTEMTLCVPDPIVPGKNEKISTNKPNWRLDVAIITTTRKFHL